MEGRAVTAKNDKMFCKNLKKSNNSTKRNYQSFRRRQVSRTRLKCQYKCLLGNVDITVNVSGDRCIELDPKANLCPQSDFKRPDFTDFTELSWGVTTQIKPSHQCSLNSGVFYLAVSNLCRLPHVHKNWKVHDQLARASILDIFMRATTAGANGQCHNPGKSPDLSASPRQLMPVLVPFYTTSWQIWYN